MANVIPFSFRGELFSGTHDFASGGDSFKLALYTANPYTTASTVYNATSEVSASGTNYTTTGNATDFGDLSLAGRDYPAGCGSPTRGIFFAGAEPGFRTVIDYVVMSSSGGANDFGDMVEARRGAANNASGNNIRGITGGGNPGSSPNDSDLIDMGSNITVIRQVEKLAKIAKETKVGVVCSGHEAKIVRKTIGPDLLIFTPGIRLKNNDKDDQKRICTPSESIKNGADKIIMGRSLIKGDIEENFNKVLNSLKSVNSL